MNHLNHNPENEYRENIVTPQELFFRELHILVEQNVERPLDATEARALAFFLSQQKQELPQDQKLFINDRFGISENDTPREIAWKIHQGIYDAKLAKIQELLKERGGKEEEERKLLALKKLIESGHADTAQNYEKGTGEIYLGGVAEYWLPEWAKGLP